MHDPVLPPDLGGHLGQQAEVLQSGLQLAPEQAGQGPHVHKEVAPGADPAGPIRREAAASSSSASYTAAGWRQATARTASGNVKVARKYVQGSSCSWR